MTWRMGARPAGPRSGFEMVIHILNCQTIFRALTRAQRRRLLDPDSPAQARVVAALQAHGLVDEDGLLTEAGAEIRAWNLPDDHPDAGKAVPDEREKAA